MDQDLRSRIKAAAQERGIDPEIAVKFAQAESSLNPNAKAKTSTASGLYQVINKTWKEYGGGDKKNIDEQIRVGTDVIASNQEKFKRKFNREPSAAELYAYHVLGPTGAPQLLRADPDTPMEKVVSPEALKANSVWKGKTVGQVLATYEKKVGGSGKAPASTEQRNTQMRPTNYSFEPLTRMDLDTLGPNYQAAMASIALADTNDSDVPTAEQVADMEEDQVMAQDESSIEEEPMMSTAAIRDIGNTQSQPILMAKGGEARKMMDAVYRADGSPEYGEISMGDFSGDTRQQLRDAITKRGRATTKEDLRLLKQIPVQTASNLESVARGSIAGDLGLPGEIEAAFTDPRADSQAFPTKSGTQGRKETFFPTTERILKNIPRLTPTNDRTEGYEEAGTYVGLGPLGYAAGKAPAAIKAAAPKVAEAMANATVPKLLKPALQPDLLQPMNIMTPSGRVFLSNKSYKEEPISNLDKALKSAIEWNKLVDNPEARPAIEFMDKKVRAYFKNNAGTVGDEIREALLTGRIKIPRGSKLEEQFPQALIDAARKGDVTAMKVLENSLHANTHLKSRITTKDFTTLATEGPIANENNRLAILEQMKNNPNMIPDEMLLRMIGKDVATMPTKEAATKVAEIRAKLAENPTLFNTVFEAKIGRLIPEDAINAITQDHLKTYGNLYTALTNASKKQEGIMALSQNAPITDIGDTMATPIRLMGLTMRQLISEAQAIPTKELERMSVADVVNRAIQSQEKGSEALQFANKAERLVNQDKPIPENIALFGTKEFLPKDNKGFVWREIIDPHATAIQSVLMKNSIKGYSERGTYGFLGKGMLGMERGEVRLFSLYDPKGQAVTNVEYITPTATGKVIDQGTVKPNSITQFFGNGPRTGNVAPSDYLPQVENLVRELNPVKIPATISELFRKNNISFDK